MQKIILFPAMKTTLLPLLALLFTIFSFTASAQTSPCPAGCDTDPLCVMEDNCFRFEYFGAVDQGNGTTQLKFKIFNASRFPFEHVMFELPGQNLPAVSPTASYISRYHYSVQNTFNDSLIKFTGLNTATFRYDQADIFRYTVNTAEFTNGNNSTIEIVAKAGILVGTVTFNLEECEDMIIEPLPVELSAFKGAASSTGIALSWNTASEKNNDFFSIQHSTDGRNFESAGYVKGNGTTSSAHSYSFNHNNPVAGKNYYRLKQVDLDGTTAYSSVIVVEAKDVKAAALALSVFPNPTQGEINIRLEKGMNASEVAKVMITDLNGRTIISEEIRGGQDLKLNLGSKLKAGMYLVKVQSGANSAFQKIIVR